MTGEEFRSLYRLGERLTKPPVVTHRATDISGAPVLVHFILEGAEEVGASYLDRVAKLPAPQEHLVREVTEVEGRSVVVTEDLGNFKTFKDWLDGAATAEVAPGVPFEDPAFEGSGAKEPGAYTQLFRVPEADPGVVSSEPSAPEPPLVPEMPAIQEGLGLPEPPPMSKSTTPPNPHRATPRPVPPEEENEGSGKAPGSYTMLFEGEVGPKRDEGLPASATQGTPTPDVTEPPSIPKPPGVPELPSAPDRSTTPEPPGAAEEPSAPELPGAPELPSAPASPGAALVPEASESQEPVLSAPVFPTPDPPDPLDPGETEHPPGSPLPWEGEGSALPVPEAPEKSPVPPKERESDGKPGAYTQIFGRPTPEGATTPPQETPGGYGAAPAPPGRPASSTPPSEPGASPLDWQRWKDTPGADGRHIPSDNYLQRLGGSPGSIPEPAPPVTGATEGSGQSPSPTSGMFGGRDVPAGPGHYTMVREGFSPDPGPPPPATQASAESGPTETGAKPATMPSRRSSLLTIVGLVVVFLTIVALVVLFAVLG